VRKSLGGKPKGEMKVKAGLRRLKWDPEPRVGFGAPLPHPICLPSGWRKSVHVGTRKLRFSSEFAIS